MEFHPRQNPKHDFEFFTVPYYGTKSRETKSIEKVKFQAELGPVQTQLVCHYFKGEIKNPFLWMSSLIISCILVMFNNVVPA